MSFENAKENLKEFGKELGLEGLEFDENNTCILGIDDEFSMHLTYEPNSDRLYIYSPIIDGLPKDAETKLRLYEKLLEGAMLGGQMAGGGVGVAPQEGLILLHCTIDMAHAVPNALRAFAPLYVKTVEEWRKAARDISEGREAEIISPLEQYRKAGGTIGPDGKPTMPPQPPQGGPSHGGPSGPGGLGGMKA
jgi:hypothetical protein